MIFRFNFLYVSSVGSLLLKDDVTGGFLETVPGLLLLCDAIDCCSNGLVIFKRKEIKGKKGKREKRKKKCVKDTCTKGNFLGWASVGRLCVCVCVLCVRAAKQVR